MLTYVFKLYYHATGEAFIGQEKFLVIMVNGVGLRKVYFITSNQNENFFAKNVFQKCRKILKKAIKMA